MWRHKMKAVRYIYWMYDYDTCIYKVLYHVKSCFYLIAKLKYVRKWHNFLRCYFVLNKMSAYHRTCIISHQCNFMLEIAYLGLTTLNVRVCVVNFLSFKMINAIVTWVTWVRLCGINLKKFTLVSIEWA